MHKNVALPKGSFVSHSLAGAEIEDASNVSGRKNVYKISWPDTEILIQTEKKIDAEQWVKEIKSAINSIVSIFYLFLPWFIVAPFLHFLSPWFFCLG